VYSSRVRYPPVPRQGGEDREREDGKTGGPYPLVLELIPGRGRTMEVLRYSSFGASEEPSPYSSFGAIGPSSVPIALSEL